MFCPFSIGKYLKRIGYFFDCACLCWSPDQQSSPDRQGLPDPQRSPDRNGSTLRCKNLGRTQLTYVKRT